MVLPNAIETMGHNDRMSVYAKNIFMLGPCVTVYISEGNGRWAASILNAAQTDTLIAALTEARRAIS